MRAPWRRRRVPEQVRAAIELVPGERVLAASEIAGAGGHMVASTCALHLVGVDSRVTRWRWDMIDRATWSPPVLTMEVRSAPEAHAETLVVSIGIEDDVPAVVRDRVTDSIVVNSRIAVPGGHARVVARRNPEDGTLDWRVLGGPGVDLEDAAVRAETARELAELRAHWTA